MGFNCCSSTQDIDITLNLKHDNKQSATLERVRKMTDKTLAFKFMFPFHRMSIETLDHKLQIVSQKDIVSIDTFQNTFCTTPAWTLLWPNVKMILRRPIFKDIMRDAARHSEFHFKEDNELDCFVPKLSISLLGLLMCTGS